MTREEVYSSLFFSTSSEIRLLLGAIILGLFLGALYDVFRALRITFKHSSVAVFFEDVLFTLIFGLCCYSFCTSLCRGQIRFYVFAAAVTGFAAYLSTVGRIVCFLTDKLVSFAKKPLLRLVISAKKIPGVLCGVPFFQKSGDKIQKNLAKSEASDV